MKTKAIAGYLMDPEEIKKFMDQNCKLLSSKQRSKNRSLFPYAKLGGRVFYPADLIVSTLHKHLTTSQAR